MPDTVIDLQPSLTDKQLETLRQNPGGREWGRQTYELLQLGHWVEEQATLCLRVPTGWLDLAWETLHDGYQYVALQRPFALTLADATPPQAVAQPPLRILLTTAFPHARSSRDYPILYEFAERFNRVSPNRSRLRIDLTVEHEVTARNLLARIEGAQRAGEPFHVWHHLGEARPTEDGFSLALRDVALKSSTLQRLLHDLSGPPCHGLRLFVLHTPLAPSTLQPALAHLPVPAAIGLTMGEASELLLTGLYARLLSHDVATATFLAQLDSFIAEPNSNHWMALRLLLRTRPLRLVNEQWHTMGRATARPERLPHFLFLRANPADSVGDRLLLDRELRFIKRALQHRRGEFVMRDEGSLTIEEFNRLLLETNPHLLHLSGHGTEYGAFKWEDEAGQLAEVPMEEVAARLVMVESLRCVVASNCHSAPLADILQPQGVVVVSMSEAVEDEAAARFSRGFYQALAHGESVARAFEIGRGEIGMVMAHERYQRDVPQLSDYDKAARIRFFTPEGV